MMNSKPTRRFAKYGNLAHFLSIQILREITFTKLRKFFNFNTMNVTKLIFTRDAHKVTQRTYMKFFVKSISFNESSIS